MKFLLLVLFALSPLLSEAKVPDLIGTYVGSAPLRIDGQSVIPRIRFVDGAGVPMIAACNVSSFCNLSVYGTQEIDCRSGSGGRCSVLANSGAEVKYLRDTGGFSLRYIYLNRIYNLVDPIVSVITTENLSQIEIEVEGQRATLVRQ